jgi:glycosyltransferase involved in cell wall biosynthesis
MSSACEFPFPENKDWGRCRRSFVWLGSFGMVHKGLDLVLEAFSARPDLHLTVCGRPEKEEDFWREYSRELKTLPNISLEGWVDIGSPRFQEILHAHGAVIYPSCSEGGGGSVIHCMQGGLVPVVTTGSSIDLMDFGFRISGDTVGQVGAAVAAFADTAPEDLESRSREAWAHVRRTHTLDAFRHNYAAFVQTQAA